MNFLIPDKMSDNEITKALEDIIKHLDFTQIKSGKNVLVNALDLINRQKAEIENYSHNVRKMTDSIYKYQKSLKQAKTEIERLKIGFENQMSVSKYWKSKRDELVEENERLLDTLEITKVEAYKEFVERLHEELRIYGIKDKFNKAVFLNVVDKVKKELVGEDK